MINISKISIIIFSLFCLQLGSCATVKNGSHTLFLVQTDPVGASVTTDKETPKSFASRAKRKQKYLLKKKLNP